MEYAALQRVRPRQVHRDAEVTLRDVLFMSHAKPKDEAQAALWRRLAANELANPDTWEVQLSAGADKKETFERLIREKKLGYIALIRKLRNMEQADVEVPDPKGLGYMINVASNRNGVGYSKWLHVDGWSDAVVP